MLPITSLFAGILLLMMTGLSIQVGLARGKRDLAFGDGDDPQMHRLIRAFGNFIEYVPMALFAMALCEANGASPIFLWAVGGILLAARIAHAAFMMDMAGRAARFAGASLTAAVCLALGCWLVIHSLFG